METIIQALAYIGPALLAWITTLAYYQDKERREARARIKKDRAWTKEIREAQEEARNAWKTAYQLKDRHAKAQAYAQEITGQLDRNGQRAWKKVHTLTKALRRSNAVAKAARERCQGYAEAAAQTGRLIDNLRTAVQEHYYASRAFQIISREAIEKAHTLPLWIVQKVEEIERARKEVEQAAQEARAADRSAGAGEGAGDPGNGPQS